MKAKLNCIMHGMLLVGAMVRRRLTPRGSVPLIAACLVVAFALPGPAWAAGPGPIGPILGDPNSSLVAFWSGDGSGDELIRGSNANVISEVGATPYPHCRSRPTEANRSWRRIWHYYRPIQQRDLA